MASVLSEVSRTGKAPKADPEAEKIARLTNREREVVALIGEGLKNKDIADRLFISETTVRHHLTSIFDKIGVSDRVELLIYAYRHGLANPPHQK
jgi:DNA-binding NarL/FixJ family response regulator